MASVDRAPLRRVSEAPRVSGRFARVAPVRRSRVVSVRAEGVPLPRSGETAEEMNARRLKETAAVEDRTTVSMSDLQSCMPGQQEAVNCASTVASPDCVFPLCPTVRDK